MPRLDDIRPVLLDALLAITGSPGRPPGLADSFASIIWAGIGLLTDPRAADIAYRALDDAGLLNPRALASADPIEVEDILKQASSKLPAKALRPLQRFAGWAEEIGFDADSASTESLRDAWRNLKGVGPATADGWLLLGLGRATYPVDRATYRILARHGWVDLTSDYDEARSVAEGLAPGDPETLSHLRLAFGQIGRDFCKPATPRCDRCPLKPLLSENGPVEAPDG